MRRPGPGAAYMTNDSSTPSSCPWVVRLRTEWPYSASPGDITIIRQGGVIGEYPGGFVTPPSYRPASTNLPRT